jgi:hypothetical protein
MERLINRSNKAAIFRFVSVDCIEIEANPVCLMYHSMSGSRFEVPVRSLYNTLARKNPAKGYDHGGTRIYDKHLNRMKKPM